MMTKSLSARLERLESLERAQIFPLVVESHGCTVVAADDRRRGSFVIEGSEVTFFCSSAAEYQEASRNYAGDRNLAVISIDTRCIDFPEGPPWTPYFSF